MDSRSSSKTVLLVDDEPAILALVGMLLRQEGYDVLTACSAADALLIAQGPAAIDALITDVEMGMDRMNGVELASRVQSEHPGIRVLVISGSVDGHDLAGQHGLPFLPKPFTAAGMRASLKALQSGPVA